MVLPFDHSIWLSELKSVDEAMTITSINSAFGTFEKDVLPKRIAERILTLIRENHFGPGDRLPPERELATMMQVSRPSVREALQALSILNIVEIRQGAGTYVTSLEPQLLVEPLNFVFSLDNSTLLELAAARKILEVGIAAIAAQNITDEEIAALEACLEKSSAAVASDDYNAFLQSDIELHSIIATASRNPILIRFMDSISQLGLASRQQTVKIPNLAREGVDNHRALVAALKAHNPEAAKQAMLEHLNNVEKSLNKAGQS